MAEYDEKLCEEVRRNIYCCIEDVKREIKDLKGKVAYFNVVGVGILVSIITSLVINIVK